MRGAGDSLDHIADVSFHIWESVLSTDRIRSVYPTPPFARGLGDTSSSGGGNPESDEEIQSFACLFRTSLHLRVNLPLFPPRQISDQRERISVSVMQAIALSLPVFMHWFGINTGTFSVIGAVMCMKERRWYSALMYYSDYCKREKEKGKKRKAQTKNTQQSVAGWLQSCISELGFLSQLEVSPITHYEKDAIMCQLWCGETLHCFPIRSRMHGQNVCTVFHPVQRSLSDWRSVYEWKGATWRPEGFCPQIHNTLPTRTSAITLKTTVNKMNDLVSLAPDVAGIY